MLKQTEQIIDKYLLAFDELNVLMQASYQESTDFEKNVRNITEDLYSCLWMAYKQGIDAVSEMLECSILLDDNRRKQVIYQEIDGMDFTERVYDHVSKSDISGLVALAQSEYHRVFNTAMADGADFVGLSKQVSKTWITVGDDKVRETHQYLEGVTIPIEEKFYTVDGDSALYPSDFQYAENNVNCRCIVEYRQERR